MDCNWIKVSPSLNRGIHVINQLEETKFEQFLHRIISKLKIMDTEIFTAEERQKLEKIFKINEDHLLLAIKTIIFLFKRLLKYILMPVNLKNDLKGIGLKSEKADFFVKMWSSETRLALKDLKLNIIEESMDSLDFSWKLNAELSSEYCKKCKVPKAYLSISGGKEEVEMELTHPEIYSIFLQFESIQNELDNLIV